MIVELTKHAILRGRQRFNLSGKALQRTAQRAFETGLHHHHTKGKLRAWAHRAICTNANHLRILGHQAFLFYDNLLITVLMVPQEAMPKVRKAFACNWPKEDFEQEDAEDDEPERDVRK